MITWTVLGSGTHFASATRGSSGHLLRSGDTEILVDCGPGSFHGIAKAGSAPENLRACLISHLHPDHVSDLLPLLFRLRNEAKSSGERRFLVAGPMGIADYLDDLADLHAPYLDHSDFHVEVEEGNSGALKIDHLIIDRAPMAHGVPTVAYGFTGEGEGRIVYSGDTGRSAELVRFAQGAELLVIESSFPNGKEEPFHLTPAEAAQTAADARVGGVILVHLNPECDDGDLVEQCGDSFHGLMMIGTDLMTHEVDGSGRE